MVRLFIISVIIHSFKTYILSTYYVPGSALNMRAINKD